MAKKISFQKGLSSVLFWSIISAAFIGPGTVATAAKAGASFGTSLVWALSFSILATIVLQEASARITIASGKNLGQFISQGFKNSSSKSLIIIFLSVFFGCAAYQAGNILGAISGLALIFTINKSVLVLGIALIVFLLLWKANFQLIAKLLGAVVAMMGILFFVSALQVETHTIELISNSVVPKFPENSSLLIVALIGTTIVPYNLFLASGISKGQSIKEMRIGLILAILIGGIISVCIMIVGSSIQGTFSFEAIALALEENGSSLSKSLFAIGLFAAGLSSSITAPFATAITAKSLFETEKSDNSWGFRSKKFRLSWISVLMIGLAFGVSGYKPIPIIIMAQAINGLLLPIVTIFLIFAVNNKDMLAEEYTNTAVLNILSLLIVGVTIYLGLNNVFSAIFKTFDESFFEHSETIKLSLSFIITLWCAYSLYLKKNRK